MGGFELSGNLRDWQTAAPRNRVDLRSEALPGNVRPLAGELKLQAVPSTRTTPEESGRYQQQPQTVSRTLGKTSLEINELALRARRPIAIVGPKMPGNRQGLPPPLAPTPRRTPVV